MAKRRDEARLNLIVGTTVLLGLVILLGSLFVIATQEGLLETRTTVSADFRIINGLAKNSPVQLSGVKIGVVREIHFTSPTYPCKTASEDFGRAGGGGRTDDCDPSLFCSNEALCAELEPFSGAADDYDACGEGGLCGEGEQCVSRDFRRRYRRVKWNGPDGICVPYATSHRRITVIMEIAEDKLVHLREDSRATIASNGVLGDQLVNLSAGAGAPLEPGGRIQAMPSLMEDLNDFKDSLTGITDSLDSSLASVSGLFDSLNDEKTKGDIKGILANVNEVTRQVAEGEGVVGALFSDPTYKEEVGTTLRSLRHTATEIDDTVTKVAKDVGPAVRSVKNTVDKVGTFVDGVNDKSNKSTVGLLLHDEAMGQDLKEAVAALSDTVEQVDKFAEDATAVVTSVRNAVDEGRGTLGKLIKDPKAYDDLVKLLGNMERNNVLKRVVRFVIEQDEASDSARPTAKSASGGGSSPAAEPSQPPDPGP